MNLIIIVMGSILLSNSITTASFWDLTSSWNSLQNSLELPGFLDKPQSGLESVVGLTSHVTNFSCISNAVDLTLQAIKVLKNEVNRCGDNTPQNIINVVKSTIDIGRKAENIRHIYNQDCAEETDVGCVTKMLNAIAKLVESVHVTQALIAKVPADPSICASTAVISFGATLTNVILSTKC